MFSQFDVEIFLLQQLAPLEPTCDGTENAHAPGPDEIYSNPFAHRDKHVQHRLHGILVLKKNNYLAFQMNFRREIGKLRIMNANSNLF